MQDRKSESQHLSRFEQMTYVSPAETPAGRASAALLYGPGIQLIGLVLQIKLTEMGIDLPVPSVSGGIHAVKEIHAPVHGFNDILRRSHPHQVGRLFPREMGNRDVQNMIHFLMCLSHRQTADGIARKLQLGDLLRVADPDVIDNAALIDPKEILSRIYRVGPAVQLRQLLLATKEPAVGPVHRGLDIRPVRLGRRAFVEGHGYGGAKIGLDRHTFLRAHEDLPSVDMGLEGYALLLDGPELRQRINLKSAGIRKDRLLPCGKALKPAQLLHDFVSRPDMEMVGITQQNASADRLKVFGTDGSFNGCNGSHIHENRRFDHPVGRVEASALRASILSDQFVHKNPLLSFFLSSAASRRKGVSTPAPPSRSHCPWYICPCCRFSGRRSLPNLRHCISADNPLIHPWSRSDDHPLPR